MNDMLKTQRLEEAGAVPARMLWLSRIRASCYYVNGRKIFLDGSKRERLSPGTPDRGAKKAATQRRPARDVPGGASRGGGLGAVDAHQEAARTPAALWAPWPLRDERKGHEGRAPRDQGLGPRKQRGRPAMLAGRPSARKNATRWPAAPCSPTGYPAVPSALGGLTSGFGMGPGVPPPPWPPAIGWHSLVTGARGCPQGRTARNGTRLSKGRT